MKSKSSKVLATRYRFANCGYCGKRFRYAQKLYAKRKVWETFEKKYCSGSCRQYGAWKKRAERKPQGRFLISKEYLREKYLKEGLSTSEIAKEFKLSPWTVYRRIIEFGLPLARLNGSRRINAPLNKTIFVIATSPINSADLKTKVYSMLSSCTYSTDLKIHGSTWRRSAKDARKEALEEKDDSPTESLLRLESERIRLSKELKFVENKMTDLQNKEGVRDNLSAITKLISSNGSLTSDSL